MDVQRIPYVPGGLSVCGHSQQRLRAYLSASAGIPSNVCGHTPQRMGHVVGDADFWPKNEGLRESDNENRTEIID